MLSEHSLLDKPIKERAAVFYCRPLVTYKDWVFSLILLLYPMILTTKEILKILIINLSSNLTYDILFSHLPSRKHYCHYCKLVRAGRAMQAGVYFVTQSSGDVAKESLKNNIGLKFAFRSTDINEIKQTLEFFGIDKDDENNQKRLLVLHGKI